jgi:hypothetical protein
MPSTGKRLGLVAMLASRALQATSVLAVVRSASPASSLLDGVGVWGLHLIGASVGDIALAQVGFTDGALVLGAAAAHLDAACALSIALAVRLAQMVWVAVGVVAACAPSPGRRTSDSLQPAPIGP